MRPNRVRPNQLRPNRVSLNRVRPNRLSPNRVSLNRLRPNRVRPNRLRPNRLRPNRVRPNRLRPNRLRPNPLRPNRLDRFIQASKNGLRSGRRQRRRGPTGANDRRISLNRTPRPLFGNAAIHPLCSSLQRASFRHNLNNQRRRLK